MMVIIQYLNIEREIFNLNLIFKLLKYEGGVKPPSLKGKLDVEGYILENFGQLDSYQTDFVMLSHLIMIAHMEVGYYVILNNLSSNIKHKGITDLIRSCLLTAQRTRKATKTLAFAFGLTEEAL